MYGRDPHVLCAYSLHLDGIESLIKIVEMGFRPLIIAAIFATIKGAKISVNKTFVNLELDPCTKMSKTTLPLNQLLKTSSSSITNTHFLTAHMLRYYVTPTFAWPFVYILIPHEGVA
jgi:hypothetical protein